MDFCRYALSDVATPPRYLNRSNSLPNHGGPLLGSSVKLSTYVDARSPGLTSRAVQYNEERKRLNPTHQKQYGSPGLFPIVHLFKKEIPQLNLQRKRIPVRIASPEYSRCSSPEYKRLLLEGIVKEKAPKQCIPQQNDVSSTRSVLDALKEISRKRIQSNDEFDLVEDTGKRLKTDQYHKETNKRYREESPTQDNCNQSQNSTKRVCINSDEYAASCSSMNFSFNDSIKQNLKRKYKSSPEQVENNNQIKRVTVETQTISIDDNKTNDEKEKKNENVEVVKENENEFKSAKRIFDEKPLYRIRKHRLAILLGTLANKETFINEEVETEAPNEAPPVVVTTTAEVPTTSENQLVSILSTPKKSSPKSSTKHVTFNLGEDKADKLDVNKESTKESKADVTPTPTSSPVMFEKNVEEEKKQVETTPPNLFSKPIQFGQTINTTSQNSSVTFTPIATTPITSITSPIVSVSSSAATIVPTITFGKLTATVSSIITPVTTSSSISPPKTGGFKFDLNKPTPIITTTTTTVDQTKQSTINFGQNYEQKSSIPTFTPSPLKFGTTPSFGATTATTTTTSSAANSFSTPNSRNGSFKFGGNTPTITSQTQNNSLFSTQTTAASTFGNNTNTTPSFGITVTSTPTFGNTTTSFATVSKPTFSFGPVTSSTASFGTVTSSTPSFGKSVAPPSFGVATPAVTTVPSFGSSVTSSTSTFGINNTSTTTTTATTPSFTFTNTFKSATPAFGNITNTTSSFTTSSIASTTAPSFGIVSSTTTTAPPAFGTLKPTFSLPNTTVQATSSTTTTTTSSNIFAFGKPSNSFTFGQNKSNSFSTPPNTSSTTSVFGGQSSFGQNQPPPPAFGATNASFTITTSNSSTTFNTPPVTSSFGSVFGGVITTTTSATTTTPSMVFGSNRTPGSIFTSKTTAAPSFGTATNIFQAQPPAQTNTNLFTTNTKPLFGTTSFTNGTAPTFGSTNNNNNNNSGSAVGGFGNANSFATNTTTSSFTTPSAFGGTNVTTAGNVFGGSTTTTPSFGASNTFGAAAAAAGGNFGAPQTNSSVFGAQVPSFGQTSFGTSSTLSNNNNNQPFGFGSNVSTSAFTATTTTNSSGFGQPPPNQSGGIFTFGAANNVPKPVYNFTGGAGTSNPPAFGAVTPQAGPAAQAVAPGMFSIGTGSPSTNRARSISKGRRRT